MERDNARPPLIDAPSNGSVQANSEGVSIQADSESMPGKKIKLGFDLLKKAGYSGIGGLGKLESGIAEPVSVVVAQESVGLGFVSESGAEEEEGNLGAREDQGPLNAVVIRIVPSATRDEEVLSLAGRWGGVRRYLRKEGTFVIELAVPEHAAEMVARCKRQGLKLGGVDVQCFLGSVSLLDEAEEGLVVESRPTASAFAAVAAPPEEQQPMNGVSKLLQSLGARLTPLPPMNEEDQEVLDKDDQQVVPKMAATTNFLQQMMKKKPTSDLLSSINKILDKKKREREEEEDEEKFAKVICDFDAQDSTQVSIRVGDVVLLRFRDEKSGWSEIEFGNSIGWVPTTYLEEQ